MAYYNTLSKKGKELVDKWKTSESQDKKIFSLMEKYKDKVLTPRRLCYLFRRDFGPIVITSVRRSLDTLKNAELINQGDPLRFVCPMDNFKTTERIVSIKK